MVDGVQRRGDQGRRPGDSSLILAIFPRVAAWGGLAHHDELLGGGVDVEDGLAGYASKQHSVEPPLRLPRTPVHT